MDLEAECLTGFQSDDYISTMAEGYENPNYYTNLDKTSMSLHKNDTFDSVHRQNGNNQTSIGVGAQNEVYEDVSPVMPVRQVVNKQCSFAMTIAIAVASILIGAAIASMITVSVAKKVKCMSNETEIHPSHNAPSTGKHFQPALDTKG